MLPSGPPAATEDIGVPNPWFSWQYITDYQDEILAAGRQHVALTLVAVGVGLLLSVPLALLARRDRRVEALVLGLTGTLYTIPSLALFGFFYPITGLRPLTVEIGLIAYTLLILVRNVLAGLDGVPAEVREAARGMGFSPLRQLLRVDLPLALPTIVAGVRIATVSTVALVTVGAVFGYGGFGGLILTGFNNNLYRAQIMTGALGCVALAVVADLALLGLQRALSPWQRRRAA